MKNIITLIALMFSLEAFSSVQGYWIESSFCGEVDPFAVGDACVLEIANEKSHMVIITDFELTDMAEVSAEDLDSMDVVLDKKHLKKASKKAIEAVEGLAPKNVPVYTIDARLLQVLNLQDDQD